MNSEKIIPAGDYKVERFSTSSFTTGYTIVNGPFKGRRLWVPTNLVPDTILTVTVQEEVTTVEHNVARFKKKGRSSDVTLFIPDDHHWLD